MALFSKTIVLLLVGMAVAEDPSCDSQDGEEVALLSRKTQVRTHSIREGNGTQCGVIWCDENSICCTDAMGNGICGAEGSTCCEGSLYKTVTVCAPGLTCNTKSAICGVGEQCGTIFCGEGSTCCDANPERPLCAAPDSECCVGDNGQVNICAAGTACWKPTGTCYVAEAGVPCTGKSNTTMIQCAGSSVCCDQGLAPICAGAGGGCCYLGKDQLANPCAPGYTCSEGGDQGVCLAR
jgi:hypothetical protein